MALNEPAYIEKSPEKDIASDFEKLMAQAIDRVQRLCGVTWTDYNLHDPGVTILEQLCYAITDLAYRTDFPIEDLLTDEQGLIHRKQHAFFDKGQILTSPPVTIDDFRKIILDEMDELDNVMFFPVVSEHSHDYMKGLYHISVLANSITAKKLEEDPLLKQMIREKVRHRYLSKRILSEDLVDVTVMDPQKISLHADITCKSDIDPESLLVSIYTAIGSILNPKCRFYSEKELLDRGMKIEDIYCGPLLKNGFIPDDGLRPIEITVDPIEITHTILQTEGVISVRDVSIYDSGGHQSEKPFVLKKDHFPLLDLDAFLANVHLYADGYKLPVKNDEVTEGLSSWEKIAELTRKKRTTQLPGEPIKKGIYRDPEKYYSLQHSFPRIYGIGAEGLAPKATEKQKAAVRQLKAYLLFFEQIQANYLAQLKNISRLYSPDISSDNLCSYFFQPLYDVPDIEDLLNAYTTAFPNGNKEAWENFRADPANGYMKALKNSIETPGIFIERKNRILDHLMARFNRQYCAYPVLQYFNLYIQGSNE